jgi:hypothetical protein
LHYNYYRDYDLATGCYSQSDPIGLAGGINTYTYIGGNPVNAIDPLGKDYLSMKLLLCLSHVSILSLLIIIEAQACAMPGSSVVYFKLFSTQTFLPVLKKDFQGDKQGGKMVIKNAYFKKLLVNSKLTTSEPFFENIRMTVNFNKQIYYINDQGDIQLENLVIGKIDKQTRDHLDKGYNLYEWETCRPMNKVLKIMLEEHNRNVDRLFKEQFLEK